MIDTKNYTLLDTYGYDSKTEAYNFIRIFYNDLKGVTTYFDNGKWYIVQSNVLK